MGDKAKALKADAGKITDSYELNLISIFNHPLR